MWTSHNIVSGRPQPCGRPFSIRFHVSRWRRWRRRAIARSISSATADISVAASCGPRTPITAPSSNWAACGAPRSSASPAATPASRSRASCKSRYWFGHRSVLLADYERLFMHDELYFMEKDDLAILKGPPGSTEIDRTFEPPPGMSLILLTYFVFRLTSLEAEANCLNDFNGLSMARRCRRCVVSIGLSPLSLSTTHSLPGRGVPRPRRSQAFDARGSAGSNTSEPGGSRQLEL